MVITQFAGQNGAVQFREKLEAELELLSAEASITGMEKAEFLKLCDGIYSKMKVCRQY